MGWTKSGMRSSRPPSSPASLIVVFSLCSARCPGRACPATMREQGGREAHPEIPAAPVNPVLIWFGGQSCAWRICPAPRWPPFVHGQLRTGQQDGYLQPRRSRPAAPAQARPAPSASVSRPRASSLSLFSRIPPAIALTGVRIAGADTDNASQGSRECLATLQEPDRTGQHHPCRRWPPLQARSAPSKLAITVISILVSPVCAHQPPAGRAWSESLRIADSAPAAVLRARRMASRRPLAIPAQPRQRIQKSDGQSRLGSDPTRPAAMSCVSRTAAGVQG